MAQVADNEKPCPRCGGTGFEIVDAAGVERARRCSCRLGSRASRALGAAGIPSRYRHCAFENFEPIRPSLRRARAVCERFCEDYPLVDHGLLLQGGCGVGKTHLAVATLKRVVGEKGAAGRFYEFNELLRRIQDSYDRRSQTTELGVLAPVLESPVVVLDDLGAVRLTPWVQDTLGLIINQRYNAELLTIVTTNRFDPPEAADGETLADRIGARARSRLAEMCQAVRIDGDDYRQIARSANFHRP